MKTSIYQRKPRPYGAQLSSFRSRKRKFNRKYSPTIYRFGYRFPKAQADVPNRKFAVLKYCKHEFVSSIPAATLYEWTYRANGMYDPEVAVGGHQPLGFDELMTQYKNFCVLGASIDVTVLGNIASTSSVWMVSVLNSQTELQTQFVAGGANSVTEHSRQSTPLILMANDTVQGSKRSAHMYIDCAKAFGVDRKTMIGHPTMSGDSAADPSKQLFFSLAGYEPLGNQEDTNALFKVVITYYACFYNSNFLTAS